MFLPRVERATVQKHVALGRAKHKDSTQLLVDQQERKDLRERERFRVAVEHAEAERKSPHPTVMCAVEDARIVVISGLVNIFNRYNV